MTTRTTARAQLSHPSGLHRDSAQCTSLYGFTSQPGPACGYHVSVLYTALILINGSTDTERVISNVIQYSKEYDKTPNGCAPR